jgi:hypothetical protein
MVFDPASQAPPAASAASVAVDRPKAIAAAITGVLVALAIWGGRLEVIPSASAQPSSTAGVSAAIAPPDSANSQAARSLARESGSKLPPCQSTQPQTRRQSQKSSSGACAGELAERAFSAGASAR